MTLPPVSGLSWTAVRSLAQNLTATQSSKELTVAAIPALEAPEVKQRMLAVYLLGFTAKTELENVEVLRQRVPADPSWEVQEALAQAFDAYCAAIGYETALPTIDAWLADPQPNARRAVSEGLRPWTARSRPYFAHHPEEAIRRLAALRADPSEYVRHSAGNALRDIRRRHADLVEAETQGWDLSDPRAAFTYARVLRAR
jgi:HEAT repeat protein